jgi:DNA-binding transcriptional ArsR family regulator
MASWSFLTNHALVLTVINQRPDSTGLEISQAVGITERAARRIIADLQDAGYIESERIGRRNRYRVDIHRPVGRIGERELTVGELLSLLEHGDGHDATTRPTLNSEAAGQRTR